MAEHVQEVSDAQFEQEVLKSDKAVLVDFWAPWCGPCRMLAPIVDQVAGQFADQMKVVKINVDDNPQTAGSYGIRSIPTLMWFKGGQNVQTAIGLLDEDTLAAKCRTVVG